MVSLPDAKTVPFLKGVTASAVSTEGVAPAADWSTWERDGRAPRSKDGAGLTTDFRDDVAQFAALGANAWRVTIEWARIEPEPGRVDTDAIDIYRDILSAAHDAGLANWLTLHSTTLPGWYLDDEGGHRDESARGRFWLRHVDRVAEAFDEFADGFVPIDDPVGWAVRGYGLGTRPPGRRDRVVLREAVEGAIFATHDAVRLLSSGRQSVMTAWRADPIHALADEDGRISVEASRAARGWDNLFWCWLRGHANGVVELDGRAPIDVPLFVNAVDHVGIVHDHPVGVGPDGGFHPWPSGARVGGAGLAPEPDELAEAMHRTCEALPDHSVVIAGHGINTDDEAWRDDLLARSLGHVRDAHHDVGVAGYFHDSGIDGYDWKLGFARPRGLLNRDRSRKRAAETFADWTV